MRAISAEESSTLLDTNDYSASADAEEPYDEPGNGLSSGEYMGPRDSFSRPTQILTPEEVRQYTHSIFFRHPHRAEDIFFKRPGLT